jgi:hypothetical protein
MIYLPGKITNSCTGGYMGIGECQKRYGEWKFKFLTKRKHINIDPLESIVVNMAESALESTPIL